MRLTLHTFAAPAALALALGLSAPAQNASSVVIQPRNGVRPRLLKVTDANASITVQTHGGNDITVESGAGGHRLPERTPDGLHRIDVPSGVNITQENDVVDIHATTSAGKLLIAVPAEISLQLKASNGPIRVDGVHGEVDVSSTNGPIELANISGTIVADTNNGSVHASMDRVDPSKPISFSSVNGAIDVTLPADLKADFKIRTVNGSIWTDFQMLVAGGQPLERRGSMSGSVNGGGLQATFSTVNGRITIRKK